MSMMNPRFKRSPILVLSCGLLLLISACNKTNQGALMQGYHDLVAHYNTNFNAHDKMKTVLVNLEKNPQDNFDSILNLYSYENKSAAAAFNGDFESIVTRCTKSIENHESSKWSDDNYFLMGQSSYMKGDYEKAAKFFQYITTDYKFGYKKEFLSKSSAKKKKKHKSSHHKSSSSSKNKNGKKPEEERAHENKIGHHPKRNASVVWLARSYIKSQQYPEASSVLTFAESDRKMPDNYDNDIRMAKAEYMISQGEYDKAIDPLKKAIINIKHKRKRARPYYVLGQLYAQLGKSKEANDAFYNVLKSNPDYNMEFNAKLSIARISASSGDGIPAAKELLLKMARDGKNADQLDQIYYQLGRIYQNENNIAEAVSYYKKSLAKSKNNNRQKGLSYVALADIYFGDEDYRQAKNYYDSTLAVVGPTFTGYKEIKDRDEKLKRLVDKLNIIETEDSLQMIAALSPGEMKKRVESIISNEMREKEKEQRQKLQGTSVNSDDNGSNGNFYFNNDQAKQKGFSSFKRTWGDRKLEDNWRRSDKAASVAFDDKDSKKDSTGNSSESKDDASGEFPYQAQLKKLTESLPSSPEKLKASNDRMIDAYYLLGNIYKDDFNSLPKAIATFETLLKKFPDNKYLVESYYTLYLLYREQKNTSKADEYKRLVLGKYPDSKYAKAILDPNFTTAAKSAEDEINEYYATSYNLYTTGNYENVLTRGNESKVRFKGHTLEPQMTFLSAMALGKLKRYDEFSAALSDIITRFPKSPIHDKAAELQLYLADLDKYKRMDSIATYQSGIKPVDVQQARDTSTRVNNSVGNSDTSAAVKNNTNLVNNNHMPALHDSSAARRDTMHASAHTDTVKVVKPEDDMPAGMDLSKFTIDEKAPHRVAFRPRDINTASDLASRLKDFIAKHPAYAKYQVNSLFLSADTKLIVVKEFSDEAGAMNFYRDIMADADLFKGLTKSDFKIFVVSAKNQSTAVGENLLDNVYYFFKKNYLK